MRSILILASAIALTGCNMKAGAHEEGDRDPGPVTQRAFPVGAFDSVSLGGSHTVIVKVGPAASVRAEGPAAVLDRLEIAVKDGDLHIGTKRRDGIHFGFRKHTPVTITITTPSLAAAAIGGSGDIRIDRVEGEKFSGSIGGSGDMEIAALKVSEADFSIAGSGGIRAAGSAGKASVSIAGSGDVDISGLESKVATVSVVGSGDVQAKAMESADVSIMGSGDVAMTGTAKCNVSKMGSGDVRCAN